MERIINLSIKEFLSWYDEVSVEQLIHCKMRDELHMLVEKNLSCALVNYLKA